MRSILHDRRFNLACIGLYFLVGCGGGDSTMIVKKNASERPDIDHAIASKGSLIVPATEPYNYASFNSGQTGTARGDAAAIGKDGARCAAQASDSGSAWGEFQIGYTFDNTSGVSLDAAVKLKLKISQTQSTTGPAIDSQNVETTGKSILRFFIKDSIGETLKSEELAVGSLLKGPASHTDNHDIVFDARFEPDRGYYLVLAGRTEVQAAKDATATLTMDVQQAVIEIEWRPIMARQAAAERDDTPIP